MRLEISWSRVAVLAGALVLPVKAGGCSSNMACFTFNQTAYAKNGGACPATTPALGRFSNNSCGTFGPISSVDGEGSFDGEFCCYPVTQASNFFDCGTSGGVGGVGGFNSSVSTTIGIGGSGGVVDVGSTTTGFTTSPASSSSGAATCFTCNDELDGTSTDPAQLCPEAATFWSALNTCNCGGGPCTTACSADACTGIMPSPACKACMTDPSSAGCGSELAACMAH